MNCGDSMGHGCDSCLAALFRPASRRVPSCTGEAGEAASPVTGEAICDGPPGVQGVWFVLLAAMAFVVPIIVMLVVVQSLENRLGTLGAAGVGLIAATLTVTLFSGMVRRLNCPSEVAGAER